MNNKIFILIIIVMILIGGGIFIYNSMGVINVDGISYKIPEDYKVVDEDDYYQIINKGDSICVAKQSSGNNITEAIDYYVVHKGANNVSVTISNFTIDDTTVFKSNSVNETSTVHYWFTKNNKVYSLFSYDKNENTDQLASKLIASAG